MCGRYAASADPDELVEEFRLDEVSDEGAAACAPRYNIAPTDTVPGVGACCLRSTTIITTSATDDVGWVHDRMPMTVADRDAWLDPAMTDGEAARDLLAPLACLRPTKVSRAVNNVAHQGASLLQPVE